MHSPSLTVLITDEPPLAAQISIGQQGPLIAVLTADYAEPLRVVISPVVITIGGGGGGDFTPSLDFSDARNGQYIPLIFEDI